MGGGAVAAPSDGGGGGGGGGGGCMGGDGGGGVREGVNELGLSGVLQFRLELEQSPDESSPGRPPPPKS